MACKFSCFLNFTGALKENDVGVFPAENGDVYRVTYKSNVCRDLLLKIEWTIPKRILVTVKLYNTTYKRCFSSKGMVVHGRNTCMKIRAAFNVSNSRNYKVLCVINLIPYITFNECNEMPSELSNESGFAESEFQQSSMDDNDITDDDTKYAKQNALENCDARENIAIDVNEESIFDKYEIPEIEEENKYQEPSDESDIKLINEIKLTHSMMSEDSVTTTSENISSHKISDEMSVLLMNKENLCLHDLSGKTKNICESFCNSRQNVNNTEETLENNFEERGKDMLVSNSDTQADELISPKDKSNDINAACKNKSRNELFITKILTLDDYSEEIIENIGTLNIRKNFVEPVNYFSKNDSPMEVDLTEMPTENHSMSHDTENKSCPKKFNPKVNEGSSNNIASEINREEIFEIFALPENTNRGCTDNAMKPLIHSEDTEANSLRKPNYVSTRNNQSTKKAAPILSNYNIGINKAEDPESSELKSICVDSPVKKSKPSTSYIEKPSDVIKDSKINNTNPESPQLSSSKTSIVFQTLVRKLSITDCDRELKDANGVESSSDMTIKKSSESDTEYAKIFPVMESELQGLSMDLLDLLTSGDMADASITNCEKDIKVHRAIVSARSPTLKKLFMKHKEDELKYRAVVDIPSYILQDVLIFLYVGLVYIESTKMAQDLYQVAERYGINDLMDICSKHIL